MSTASSSRPLPRPLHLGSISITGASEVPNAVPAHVNGPLSAPLSQRGPGLHDLHAAKVRSNPRRQSSISYNTGSSKPASPGLGRRNSLGSKTVSGDDGSGLGAGTGAGDESGFVSKPPSLPGVREVGPVTLAEKHADLLRFIAQKESKCLELRTQLAQHEADLLLLKRKWERIVSKGLPSTARSDGSASMGGDMLDGIREGVQHGLGKMLAVLEPSSAGGAAAGSPQAAGTAAPSNSRRHSQQLRLARDAPGPSSSKRASTSTASSSSTRNRPSLSGSRSSSSSLFDELSPFERQSPASSVEEESTACPSPEPPQGLQAGRGSSPPVQASANSSNVDDPSAKKRRPRPSSMNLSPFSYPLTDLTPFSKQVASWVPPGLNKKWEELKGSETLSKQSKRASILLNDVLAVLAPPPPASSLSRPPPPAEPESASKCKPPSDHADAGTPSLLDETDECGAKEVLQPTVKAPGASSEGAEQNKKEEDKDDEEWNW